MDPFRSYYISSIFPELKKIENERRILEKKIMTITIITIIILTAVVGYLFILTHNINVAYLYFAIPMPYTFLLKDLIKSYSKKYKETVIKNLFLSYFEHYTIDTERKSDLLKIPHSGLLPLNKNYRVETEDFITVKNKGNDICIQEIIIKQNKKVFLKGMLYSLTLKKPINQNLIFKKYVSDSKSKFIEENGFKMVEVDNVSVYYQNDIDKELLKPFIAFTVENNLPLSIQNGKLYCLSCSDMVFNDKLDLFEPVLLSKYNSNDTYRFIRDEYKKIDKISSLLIKLEEINMA
ncbi:MAG: hypothetical protein WAL29_05095 [Bacteroidales bacterium]